MYFLAAVSKLLQRPVSHQGLNFRMKKTHVASSPCIAMLQQNPIKWGICNSKLQEGSSWSNKGPTFGIHAAAAWALCHSSEAIHIPSQSCCDSLPPSCFKCFCRAEQCELSSEEVKVVLLILNMPGLFSKSPTEALFVFYSSWLLACSPGIGLHFGVITQKKLKAFSRQRKLISFYSELYYITSNPVIFGPLQMKTIKDKQLWSISVTVAIISHP